MVIVGVTGPTGSGKSLFREEAEKMGWITIDCDQVYHELLAGNENMLRDLRERFGSTVFDADGWLNRKALGDVVFADEKALADLNGITHPYVIRETDRRIEQGRSDGKTGCVLEAVALLECGLADRCQCTVAVLAPPRQRLERIMAREGISESYARSRICAQKPDRWYSSQCTITVHNSWSKEKFRQAVVSILTDAQNSGGD